MKIPFDPATHQRSYQLYKACLELQEGTEKVVQEFHILSSHCASNKAIPEAEGFIKEMQSTQGGWLRNLGDRVEKLTSRGPTLFQAVASQYSGLREYILQSEEYLLPIEAWAGEQRDFVQGVMSGIQGVEEISRENAELTRRIKDLELSQCLEEEEEMGYGSPHHRAEAPRVVRAAPVSRNRIIKEQALVQLYNQTASEGSSRKTAYLSFIEEDALILKAMLSKKEITTEDAEKYHSAYSKVLEGVKSHGSTSVSQNVQALKDEIDRAKTPSWFSSRVEVLAVEEAAATKHETMAYMVSKVVAVAAAVTVIFGAGLFWGGRFSK